MKKAFKFPVKDSQFAKASASKNFKNGGGGGGETCVLIAKTEDGVALRDSKDPQKRTLFFNHLEFDLFSAAVKAGEFD